VVSPDGVAPSRMVSVCLDVNLPLHHKVQKFSSGTGSPGWSRKKGHEMVVVDCLLLLNLFVHCIKLLSFQEARISNTTQSQYLQRLCKHSACKTSYEVSHEEPKESS